MLKISMLLSLVFISAVPVLILAKEIDEKNLGAQIDSQSSERFKSLRDRASKAFDELENEVQHGRDRQKDQKLELEFAKWKEQYVADLESQKKKIQKKWPAAHLSNKQQEVTYSDDYNIRQIVDYEKNEVVISVHKSIYSEKDIAKIKSDIAALLKKSSIPVASDEINKIVANVSKGESFESGIKSDSKARNIESSAQEISSTDLQTDFRQTLDEHVEQYGEYIAKVAEQQKLEESIIYAIIQTESAFRPKLKSGFSTPTFGLMQISPEIAGREITHKLEGKERLLTEDELFDPEYNIQAGSVYLGILFHDVFKEIEDPQSRLYCVVAAYSAGKDNVALVFDKSKNIENAVSVINKLNSDGVFKALTEGITYDETRKVIEKVLSEEKRYSNYFNSLAKN